MKIASLPLRRREFIAGITAASVLGPDGAWAELPTTLVVGFLNSNKTEAITDRMVEFRQGLADRGFVEGKNVRVEYRMAEQRLERLPALTMDLVRRQVAVIVAGGADIPALVAKGATTTIPIVFATGTDPVRSGLVASLNRPGGNVTGATVIAAELGPKRLQIIRELIPSAKSVAIIINPNNPGAELDVLDLRTAAKAVGQQVQVVDVSSEPELEHAFVTLATLKVGALMVNPDPLFQNNARRFAQLAAGLSLPTIYYTRDYPAVGGLISYGASFLWLYRQAGQYAGRILKGEKPGDLPVVQPTKFDLVINLKTAKALGITVPATLLARADEVIE